MIKIFLVSSWDISHSQFGIQNQILVSRGYRDTANFRPCNRTETPQPADIAQSLPTLESVLKLASHLENTHCIS